jgi:hypothetical protein
MTVDHSIPETRRPGAPVSTAQWVLNTIGRALLAAMVIIMVMAAATLVTGQSLLFFAGLVIAPVWFAWELTSARQPD